MIQPPRACCEIVCTLEKRCAMKTVLGYLRPPCRAGRRRCRHQIHRSGPGADPPLLLAEIIDSWCPPATLPPSRGPAAGCRCWLLGRWAATLPPTGWPPGSHGDDPGTAPGSLPPDPGTLCTQADQFSPSSWCPASPMTPTMSTRCLTRSSGADIRPHAGVGRIDTDLSAGASWRWCSWR